MRRGGWLRREFLPAEWSERHQQGALPEVWEDLGPWVPVQELQERESPGQALPGLVKWECGSLQEEAERWATESAPWPWMRLRRAEPERLAHGQWRHLLVSPMS